MMCVTVATALSISPASQSQKFVAGSAPSWAVRPTSRLAAVWTADCAYWLVDQSVPSSASICIVASAGFRLAYTGSGTFEGSVVGGNVPLEYVSPPVCSTTAARFAATFTGEYCAPGVSVYAV